MPEGFEGFDVSVRFRGLCGFVPGRPWGEQQSWVGAFLVNATQEVKEATGVQAKAHQPLLIFNLRDLEDGDHFPDQKAYVSLLGEDVVFRADSSTPSRLETAYSRELLGTSPESCAQNDTICSKFINWLPQIDEAIAGAGTVQKACFAEEPPEDVLATRVHLTFGALKADDIGRSAGRSVLSQYYPCDGTPQPRAMANSVLWQAYDIPGTFEVLLRRFGSQEVRVLRFRRPTSGSKRLSLKVVNLCSDEIFGFARAGLPEPDPDYRWMYRLSAVPKTYSGSAAAWQEYVARAEVPVPHPVQYLLTEDAAGILPKMCTPPRFEPPDEEIEDLLLELVRMITGGAALEGALPYAA
jgi:hypothetical protein